MQDVQALAEVEIPSMKGKVSEEEWAIRVDLAAAYRLVAHYGWDDLIFTHLSAALRPEHPFPAQPLPADVRGVTASSLVKVDVHGNPVEPTPFITNPAGFTIHSAVHMAREDAHAVMHLHTPAGRRSARTRRAPATDANRDADPRATLPSTIMRGLRSTRASASGSSPTWATRERCCCATTARWRSAAMSASVS